MPPTPVNILLAEDNPGDVRLVSELLRTGATGLYRLTQVGRLSELAKAISITEFDILLLDLLLPDSGCPTVKGLLAVQSLNIMLPIVVLTGLSDHDFALSAVQRGIQDYLVKGSYTDTQLWTAIEYGIERKRAELRLAHMALYDGLTGVANRTLFLDRLQQSVTRLKRGSLDGFIVMALDLDHFKAINDTYGHPAGDSILKTAGERLERCMRRSDTVGRLGGDEFGLLLEGITSEEGARIAVMKILAAMDAPLALNGQELTVLVSVGIARCPAHGTNAAHLMEYADQAMYQAKRSSSRYALYQPDCTANRSDVSLQQPIGLKRIKPIVLAEPPEDITLIPAA